MAFADNLKQLPPVTHLAELQLLDAALDAAPPVSVASGDNTRAA